MDEESDHRYDRIIEGFSSVRGLLPGTDAEETADSDPSSRASLSRRSYLAGAGMAAATLAGCAGRPGGTVVKPVTVFSYGGGAALRQTETTLASITESEPNDTRQNATRVPLGTRVDGSLEPSDGDWYALDVSSGQQIAVTFQRTSQTGVTAVIAYDPDGTFSNLRYVTTDEVVTFEMTAETSGTHHVQVVDTQSSDAAYTLSLETASASDSTDTDSGTETPTSPSVEDDYGQQGYGEYGYGGIEA
ncbi:hypothetical protein ABNG02_03085 [Halorubrum ejinorense]|uniref:Uncharacterized protein n=1 Tax=Halorubrum ejinorense TaxID=425309 RepID=A0AAV3SWM3_9EURY